jgi:hypothetical protein
MDEDNNPFAGSTHLFASGVSGFEDLHSGFQGIQGLSTPQEQLRNEYEEEDDDDLEDDHHHHHETAHYHNGHNDYSADDSTPIYITDTSVIHGTVLYTIHYTTEQGSPLEARRRYSEFASLRLTLCRLLPTVVVPPLPHKHTLAEYLLNPFNAKTDPTTISSRKRLLTSFLQRCYSIPQIYHSPVWNSFLDPVVNWGQVLITPPVSLLPSSSLSAPPLDPVKPSPLHLLLPIPRANYSGTHIDNTFHEYQQRLINYRSTTSQLNKIVKKSNRHFTGLVRDLGQLGALYNAFSLENTSTGDNDLLSLAIEKTGQAIDVTYLNAEVIAFKLLVELQEPILEIKENSKISVDKVLSFQRLKTLQLSIVQSTIKIREDKIKSLKNLQYQSDRLEEVLNKSNAHVNSSSINTAVSKLQKGDSVSRVSSPWLRLFHAGNTRTNDISKLNQVQRTEEIEKIESELVKLNDCLRIVTKDIEQINEAIHENLDELMVFFRKKWDVVINNYTKSLMVYLKDNLKAWEEAKLAIDEI